MRTKQLAAFGTEQLFAAVQQFGSKRRLSGLPVRPYLVRQNATHSGTHRSGCELAGIGAWLAGPSTSAVHLRGIVTRREPTSAPGAFARWVGRAKVGLRVVVIAVGAIALVAIDQPTGWTVLVVALIVLAFLVIIELVGRAAPRAVAT